VVPTGQRPPRPQVRPDHRRFNSDPIGLQLFDNPDRKLGDRIRWETRWRSAVRLPLVLKIALEADDLAATRFTTDVVWEAVASVQAGTRAAPPGPHRPLPRLLSRVRPDALGVLAYLTNVPGWLPDTLAPSPGPEDTSPAAQISRLRHTDPRCVESDLSVLRQLAPESPIAWGNRVRLLNSVTDAMATYWAQGLSLIWESAEAIARADIAFRQGMLSRYGLGPTLQSLHRGITYRGSVLTLPLASRRECTVLTTGQGIDLIPSVFRGPSVVAAFGANRRVTICYPARGAVNIWTHRARRRGGRALAQVVGRSRAAIMQELKVVPRSTTDLARQLELAPGTVSAHLSALAQSGLAVSAREGRLVLYSLTTPGRELLKSSVAPDLSGS